jgi:uncharacterized membrane protein
MKKVLITSLLTACFLSSATVLATSNTTSKDSKIEIFDVVNIKQGNSLSMHAWPSLTSEIVVAIPHNAQSITYKGSKVKQDDTIWKKVHWNSNKGWVTAKHLQSSDQQSVEPTSPVFTSKTSPQATTKSTSTNKKDLTTNKKQTILACGGSKPFWSVYMNLTNKKILVDLHDGKAFSIPLENRKWDTNNNKMKINGGQEQQAIKATLNKTNTCTDKLTSIKYPFTVDITIGTSKRLNGCCRTLQK